METKLNCTKCALHKLRDRIVWGDGDLQKASIMMIGEAPGEEEDKVGTPFVGRSGQYLRGVTNKLFGPEIWQHIYITNMICCRPPNNRNPRPHEVKNCGLYLRRKIILCDPKVIICLGRVASDNMLEKHWSWGKFESYTTPNGYSRAIGIYHPSYLLRNQGKSSIPMRVKWHRWLKKAIVAGLPEQIVSE